jgi:cbb3-type cytochrome oxidase subunit 3
MRGLITSGSSEIAPILTALFFAMFVGYVVYLYLPSRKKYFEEASKMPLDKE